MTYKRTTELTSVNFSVVNGAKVTHYQFKVFHYILVSSAGDNAL